MCSVADMVAFRATERKLDAGASIISDVYETSQDVPPLYVHGALWRCYAKANMALLWNPRLCRTVASFSCFIFYATKKEVPFFVEAHILIFIVLGFHYRSEKDTIISHLILILL